jgi:hypothetical protein
MSDSANVVRVDVLARLDRTIAANRGGLIESQERGNKTLVKIYSEIVDDTQAMRDALAELIEKATHAALWIESCQTRDELRNAIERCRGA